MACRNESVTGILIIEASSLTDTNSVTLRIFFSSSLLINDLLMFLTYCFPFFPAVSRTFRFTFCGESCKCFLYLLLNLFFIHFGSDWPPFYNLFADRFFFFICSYRFNNGIPSFSLSIRFLLFFLLKSNLR